MAFQKGILKLKGALGGISFYETQDGYLAREKGGVSGERIKNDPMFVRTRENGAEFGRAGQGASILRSALRTVLAGSIDTRMSSRLTAAMMRVVKGDTTSIRGARNAVDGNATLLQGFEFNDRASLDSVFKAPYTTVLNRVTGNLTLNIAAFNPSELIAAPNGSDYLKLVFAATAVDFATGEYVTATSESPNIATGSLVQPALQLVANVPPASTHPLFLVLGIKFFQEVNGHMYKGASNALALIAVDAA
jgi:hypothetical protein